MRHVNKQLKSQWGSYSDRVDSFDDSEDISKFLSMTNNDCIVKYLRSHMKSGHYYWVPHPDGQYGVDLALVEKDTEKRIANFDLERWSAWKQDWPDFYRAIHFLGRKEKFTRQGVPFFVCYLNYSRDRVLMVDEEVILQYPTVQTHFKTKNVTDTLKKIPLHLGNIFGKYTEKEGQMFNTWG